MDCGLNIIAVAKPSVRYRWCNNLKGIEFLAVKNGSRLSFYIRENETTTGVSRDFIKSFFKKGISIKDQPFRRAENKEFFNYLNR